MKKRSILVIICIVSMLAACLTPIGTQAAPHAGDSPRDKVWNVMWKMATVAWTPSRTVYYNHASEQIPAYVFQKNVTYIGMPYTQSMSSIERFARSFSYQDGNGVLTNFQPWVPVQYTSAPGGNDTIDILMGNDCSGAIYWAVSKVADVSFKNVREMMPANGTGLSFLSVDGATPFSSSEKEYTSKIITDSFGEDSEDDLSVAEKKKAELFKYYAAVQLGDVLAGSYPAGVNGAETRYGHSMMVESVEVETDPSTGEITGGTVTVLQNGSPGNGGSVGIKKAELNENGISVGSLGTSPQQIIWNYGTITFEELYYNYYIPLTVAEYGSSGPLPQGQVSVSSNNTGRLHLTDGVVTSEKYRLQSVTISIYEGDSDAGSLKGSVTLDTATYRWNMYKSATTQRVNENSIDLMSFAPYLAQIGMKHGDTYYYVLSARLADENDYRLREYAFVY